MPFGPALSTTVAHASNNRNTAGRRRCDIFSAFVPRPACCRRCRRGPDGVHDGCQARRGKASGSGAPFSQVVQESGRAR